MEFTAAGLIVIVRYIVDSVQVSVRPCNGIYIVRNIVDSVQVSVRPCNGIHSSWSHRFCPVHCGFCPSKC